MSNWISERKKQVEELSSYVLEIQKENEIMKQRLASIAVGFVHADDASQSWSDDTKLQNYAARLLHDLAKRPRPKMPSLWW